MTNIASKHIDYLVLKDIARKHIDYLVLKDIWLNYRWKDQTNDDY